jgi:hypothetical protein
MNRIGASLPLPKIFVWTKLGPDAGESPEQICHRKELERQTNEGCFWWGLGQRPSPENVAKLLDEAYGCAPLVISLMRGTPKTSDTSPQQRLIWESYRSCGKFFKIPKNVIVTSRGHDQKESKIKTKHYALVCHSDRDISKPSGQVFYIGSYRNFPSKKTFTKSSVSRLSKSGETRNSVKSIQPPSSQSSI